MDITQPLRDQNLAVLSNDGRDNFDDQKPAPIRAFYSRLRPQDGTLIESDFPPNGEQNDVQMAQTLPDRFHYSRFGRLPRLWTFR